MLPITAPPKFAHHDHDAPAWWNFKKKDRMYSDGFAAKGARPLMTKVEAGSSSDMGKISVLTASNGDESANDEKTQGHGLFTYYLLKSLNDNAGKDTVSQAYGHFSAKVQEAARQANQSQTPQLLGADAATASLR